MVGKARAVFDSDKRYPLPGPPHYVRRERGMVRLCGRVASDLAGEALGAVDRDVEGNAVGEPGLTEIL